MNYPGGKNGGGAYQTIINQMPPHEVYIEPFLGSGAVLRAKRPAIASIGIDRDAACIAAFPRTESMQLLCGNALDHLKDWRASTEGTNTTTLIYCDPPYLRSTRRSQSPIYQYEFWEEDEHRSLLAVLRESGAMVILSGYASKLYNELLPDWRTLTYNAITRGGTMAKETLWMNYPEPLELHDYRFLGKNFRERERIKRQKARWLARLQRMPTTQRYAFFEVITELREGGSRIDARRK